MLRTSVPTPAQAASCHASSVIAQGERLLVAYFAGPAEGSRRTGIWLSQREGAHWREPRLLWTGRTASGLSQAGWNPVFFAFGGELFLFFKVGAAPESWRGYYAVSVDFGESWSQPVALPRGILGPTKNGPVQVGAEIVSGSSDERDEWSVHFELSTDGRHWRTVHPAGGGDVGRCIQPAILDLQGGRLVAYARTTGGRIARTRSDDSGRTWSALESTRLLNPDSAITALTVRADCHVLGYNPSADQRTPLVLAVSRDGEEWIDRLTLESGPGEFSYPSACLTPTGLAICYTVNRRSLGLVEMSVASLLE